LKKVLLLILIVFSQHLLAQGEGNIWYFGFNAGLDFNENPPVALTNGSLFSNEGCATICDVSGNLLFYTESTTVWNKNHDIMDNGEGLLGSTSTTQSSIIIKKPEANDTYFVFTLDFEAGENGFRYSEVNMTSNAGLGSVLSENKNTLLLTPVAEKVTAVQHADGVNTWVVVHGWDNNDFYAFLVTNSGVSNTPIISSVGPVSDGAEENSVGALIFSPNGDKAVLCNNKIETVLLDFDADTGEFSNPITVNNKTNTYGAAFSPLGNVLYTSNFSKNIFQYDLNAEDINASEVILFNNQITQFGQLQIGPDDKIYVTESGGFALSVINLPENLGNDCDFSVNSVDLNGATSGLGLPAFIQSFFIILLSYEKDCFGDETQFYFNTTADAITWDFGDSTTGLSNISNDFEPTHLFSAPGIYQVTATITKGSVTSTDIIEVEIFALPEINTSVQLNQCDDDTNGISAFNLELANSLITNSSVVTITYHETLNDAEDNINAIINNSDYNNQIPFLDSIWARVENNNGCYDISQVDLIVSVSQIPETFHRNFYECDDDTDGIAVFNFSSVEDDIMALFPANQPINIKYYTSLTDALIELNAIENISSHENTNAPITQDIYVRIENELNDTCLGLGVYVTLTVFQQPQFILEEHAIICMDDSPNLTVSITNPLNTYDYTWTNSSGTIASTEPSLTVTSGDTYTVIATYDYGNGYICESIPHVITIEESEIAILTPNSIIIDDGFANNAITVDLNTIGFGNYEYAINNSFGPYQDTPVFNNVSPGEHTIYVRDKNGCGTSNITIYVIGFPNYFTPNNDTVHDFWNIKGYSNSVYKKATIYIYNRYGKLLTSINPLSNGWDGTFNGKSLPSTDYWFTVELVNNNNITRNITGHFSLLR
jgi:gliding motility-associated-like protein